MLILANPENFFRMPKSLSRHAMCSITVIDEQNDVWELGFGASWPSDKAWLCSDDGDILVDDFFDAVSWDKFVRREPEQVAGYLRQRLKLRTLKDAISSWEEEIRAEQKQATQR